MFAIGHSLHCLHFDMQYDHFLKKIKPPAHYQMWGSCVSNFKSLQLDMKHENFLQKLSFWPLVPQKGSGVTF